MKRLFLLVLTLMTVTSVAHAFAWWNNPPEFIINLNSTNLPIVWIEVDEEPIDRYERITGRMKIIYNGEGQLNYTDTIAHPGQRIDYEGYIALRYRGSSSYLYSPKKPYSFRTIDKPLEEGGDKVKVEILGMGKDNNWALLAPYADKSMLRDLLAFEVSRPWMEYVPQGRFCELILDDIYYGVHILTEVVSKGKHRVNLKDPGEEGDELTGGYIMEVNRVEDEEVYTSKYHPVSKNGTRYNNQYIHFQFKSPDYEEMTEAQIDYITGRIDEMETALWNYRPEGTTSYRNYIDEANFVDYQLAQEFGHNVDAYRLSGKFFKRRDSEDARFKMVLWDMNLAYGNADYYDGWRTDTWMYQNNNILNQANDPQLVPFWWYKLNTNPEYIAALKARWAQYRRANLREDRLMATVDSLANVLTSGGAERRNSQAWPRWGVYVWPNYYVADSYADEIAYIKNWLTERIAWMDEQLEYDPTAILRGDVNDDGRLTIDDVTALIGFMLTGSQEGFNVEAADVDEDGVVRVADITTLIGLILNNPN